MAKSCRSWSRSDAIAVVLLCLLVLAFYRDIALGNGILAGVDAFTYFYPYRQVAAETIRSGHLPLWNPYLFMGAPFIANAQTAVFYPLNLALCWLDGPRLVAWSIVIHVALAAISAYLYARLVLRLSSLAALLGACAFALGGFLSGMVEHINQLNASAWFPLLLLLWEWAQRETARQETGFLRKTRFLTPLGVLIGVSLLAGHAQSTYICLFGLGVYAVLEVCAPLAAFLRHSRRAGQERRHLLVAFVLRTWHVLWQLGLVVLVGASLAAIQLVPTAELSAQSIRGGGLSYREAIAFSLKPLPRLLRYTFLPPWQGNLADAFGGDFFTEYVAYMGVIPLLLAIGWVGSRVVAGVKVWSRKGAQTLCETGTSRPTTRLLILAGLGLFLAVGGYNPLYWLLYKLVPGFGLFRVPARWLFLYAFSGAMLAGVGLQNLWDRLTTLPRVARNQAIRRFCPWIAALVVALTVVELFLASQAMPLAHPTAPEAFSSLRTAPAHILAAQSQEPLPGRFLSLSDTLFDPGDQREIEQMFAGQLDNQAIYAYVVSAKRKEILAPNLPLAWRVYAVDGYDGGVLPLQRYVDLQTLFLPADRVSPDGRLRENLERIPPFRLLSLLGVRYVITDKVHDVWIDDVFYDLAFEAVLGYGTTPILSTADLPTMAANALGIVAYVESPIPAANREDGTPPDKGRIAEVRLFAATVNAGGTQPATAGQSQPITLPLYAQAIGAHAGERQAVRLRWDRPLPIERIEIEVADQDGTVHVQGLALIDERDGSSVPVLLSGEGRVRLVHSGDVKVYELPDALPRAYVVHEAVVIEDNTTALAAMADPRFDPARQVILHAAPQPNLTPNLTGLGDLSGLSPAAVTPIVYEPERIVLQATLSAPGYLVLSEAFYPGWKATVDSVPAEMLRANVHFRAIAVAEGTHTVELVYQPASFFVGLAISLLASLGVVMLLFYHPVV